jgi:hypothetical protein
MAEDERGASGGTPKEQRMFVGHMAVALGAKAIEPRLPLGAAVASAFGLDLLWPVLLLLGAEVVQVRVGDTAFTNLSFVSYPWSHSLLVVTGWSILTAVGSRGLCGSWRVGSMLGGLVLSHWFLDVVTHRPDMPLWPFGPVIGLGLWDSIAGTILLEGSLLVAGLWMYLASSGSRDRTGSWGLVGLVALTSIVWVTQPWSPPPPNATAVAWGALVLWLLPPWARWIDAHREPR